MRQHTLRTSISRITQIAGFACVFAIAAAGAANAANRIGWVWGNQPNSAVPYTPAIPQSYNSAGGTITIVPVSTGVYQVQFGNLYDGAPDDVQVTARATGGYCTSGGWSGSKKNITATVNCYDVNGTPANRFFTLLYQSRSAAFGTPTRGIAFLWADQPAAASYTPSLARQYNSTGGVNFINRSGVGRYVATLPGLTAFAGDVQVTAYSAPAGAQGGGTGPARCKVESLDSNSNAMFVTVLCFDNKGQPADEYFDLAFALHASFALTGSATLRGIYAWADQPANPGPYFPAANFRYNGFATGALTAQRSGVGLYSVTIPGALSYKFSNALSTAYGGTNSYCNIVKWITETINVACYNQGGAPVDSQFDLGFQTSD